MKNGNIKMRFGVTILIVILLSSCQSNKWYGEFDGISTESSQINRLQPNGETKYFSGGRSTTNDTVTLMREGKVAFVAIKGNCKLRMILDDATHARISEGQTCKVNINGYEGKVNMSGQAYFEGDGKLMIQFTGTAAEPNHNGGYAYNFTGTRRQ
jgi:hypothetical protein